MANFTKEHQIVLNYSKQILSGAKKFDLSMQFDKKYTARCVETPWVAERLIGVKNMLDVGFTFASPEYLGMILELKDRYGVELKAVDIIEPMKVQTRYPENWLKSILEVPVTIGDVRNLDLPKEYFDAVTVISTIEHIGFDEPSRTLANSSFERKLKASEVNCERDPETNKRVLDNLFKTLKKKGKLLVTTPMGKGGAVLTRDSLGFYTAEMEYNTKTWKEIVGHEGFHVEDQRFFKLSDKRWEEVSSSEDLKNQSHGTGVALVELAKH